MSDEAQKQLLAIRDYAFRACQHGGDWETLFQMADQPCISGPGEIPGPGSPSDYNELRTALENLLKWPTSPAMQETARDVLARLTAPATEEGR